MFCNHCGTTFDDQMQFCPTCGTPARIYNTTPAQPTQPDMPMKWFKFLIYFSLFASAVLNAISGFRFVSGTIYGESSGQIYSVFSNLKILDMIIGVVSIAFAGLAIYTRVRLAGFFANGPKLVCITYAAGAIINIVYIVGILTILPSYATEYIDFSSNITNIVVSILMVGANYVYFNKRSHLFVN